MTRMALSSFDVHDTPDPWEKKAQVNIHLPIPLIKIADKICKREFRSKSSFFAKIIFDHFPKEEIEKFKDELVQEKKNVDQAT